VTTAEGVFRVYTAPTRCHLPTGAAEGAADAGLHLDQEAAKALVGVVGTRQQRLQREIEKLAIVAHPRTQLSADEVERLAAGDASMQVYDLADAVVAGDLPATMRLAESLTAGEDRPSRLLYPIVRRLRDVHRATELLDAGVPEQKVAGAMKMAPWQAKRTLAQAKRTNRDSLAQAICLFADLERDLRGAGELDEDTAFSLALAQAAA
jgi:DNA polymerase-3 subunit delta